MNIIAGQMRREQLGTGLLITATVVVGASIVAEGALGRALNGLGGMTWFASAAVLVWEARSRNATGLQWLGVGVLTAGVAFVVRPSDLTLATAGFGGAGLIAGLIGQRNPLLFAKLVPAIYLPMHIGTAVLKAAGRGALGMEASVRTEPPPIATVVPAVMVAAALAGGWVARRLAKSRQGSGMAPGALLGKR